MDISGHYSVIENGIVKTFVNSEKLSLYIGFKTKIIKSAELLWRFHIDFFFNHKKLH